MKSDKSSKRSQLKLFKDQPKAYGGTLLNTRKGRAQGRPLSIKHSMHLVLKSSQAKGRLSFRYQNNPLKIRKIINRFANKYGVSIQSMANVGNHLHIQIKLGNRFGYKPFIRATTSAIAMAITGINRWTKRDSAKKFWDYRPYSRVVLGWKALLSLKDYIEVNQWEGRGFRREEARMIVKKASRRRPLEWKAQFNC